MPLSTHLDDQDSAILTTRMEAAAARPGPRLGDYVDFADGVTRRISHIWDDMPVASIQTSDGGSFYLGERSCSFSGGLEPGIPADTLTLTETLRQGWVWFFHHDWWEADNGVTAKIPCRVFTCTLRGGRSA